MTLTDVSVSSQQCCNRNGNWLYLICPPIHKFWAQCAKSSLCLALNYTSTVLCWMTNDKGLLGTYLKLLNQKKLNNPRKKNVGFIIHAKSDMETKPFGGCKKNRSTVYSNCIIRYVFNEQHAVWPSRQAQNLTKPPMRNYCGSVKKKIFAFSSVEKST